VICERCDNTHLFCSPFFAPPIQPLPGVLLKTLCDKSNWIGEIGYFLASFEAAITHIQEIDLSEDRDSMLSFASTPLTDISLG
jgi:hypothetical protein